LTVVAWEWVIAANGKRLKKVYGTITGTSGTTEDTGLRKIVVIEFTRVHSTYAADGLKVEPEYTGDGGTFTLRVTDTVGTSAAEDTTTSVTVHYIAIGF